MKKPFIMANVREITNDWFKEKITFSKMVELLNDVASEFYANKEMRDCLANMKTYSSGKAKEAFKMFLDGVPTDHIGQKIGCGKARVNQIVVKEARRLYIAVNKHYPNDVKVLLKPYISILAIRSNIELWHYYYNLYCKFMKN